MSLLTIHEPGQTPLPHEDTAAVGIDLGTTHSVVAIVHNGIPQAIEDAHDQSVIPSAVWYGAGHAVVGQEAKRRWQEGDGAAIASIKRLMGRSGREAVALMPHLAGVAGEDGPPRLTLGGKGRTPVEISADILRHLKTVAEEALGREVSRAVITVPAYFDDAARLATKDAAQLAGLEVLRLISEPTAAALAYGLEHAAEGIYAVYDLGGGTFDISLLRLEGGVFQVLATAGDTALGGDDLDRAIAERWSQERSEPVTPALLAEARHAKEGSPDARTPLAAHLLAELAKPLIDRTLAICGRALEDAAISKQDIKGVVLVGGSTRLAAARQAVEEYFGKTPLSDADPDRVVAYGAALQAHNLTQGGDHLLLDVVPLSLGLEMMGGIVEKIIWRNTPIPTRVAQEFTTYQDGQTGLVVHVVQGEREMAGQCRSLARLELTGIPPMTAGAARIRIAFTVDADGLLTVAAEEITTGIRQQIEVRPSYGLPPEEMERMLRESMEHAREDMTGRLLAESRLEADRLLVDLSGALKADGHLLSDAERGVLARQSAALREVMQEENRDAIDAARHTLERLVGPFAERRMNAHIGVALKGAKVDEI